jgi:dihydrofolate synthase/folylpolyglutamate synthase
MNYAETVDYLFNKTANFEHQGQAGYKPGLETMLKLDEHFEHPHESFRSIHIAGTNGKGSVSHSIAALLQVFGYRVGLYTSPHLVDFSERIRVNGQPIAEDYVTQFVEKNKDLFDKANPSFFEIATEMAFCYFRDMDVDIAVVEVGLGGRLDSTNIITPILSVITNISLDHTQLLGASLEQIAMEKGGIIKPGIPVVIGEHTPETRMVFEALATEAKAPIHFAEDDDEKEIVSAEPQPEGGFLYKCVHLGDFKGELSGIYQQHNTNTIMVAMHQLMDMEYICLCYDPENNRKVQEEMNYALQNVCTLTGLMGRWQKVRENPTVICDTGHNVAGWEALSKQLSELECEHLHIIFGMVDDKDIYGVMNLLPKNATYYYTKGSTKRAFPETSLKVFGDQFGLSGESYPTVAEAYKTALLKAKPNDVIFIGGSTYVVADFLKTRV